MIKIVYYILHLTSQSRNQSDLTHFLGIKPAHERGDTYISQGKHLLHMVGVNMSEDKPIMPHRSKCQTTTKIGEFIMFQQGVED